MAQVQEKPTDLKEDQVDADRVNGTDNVDASEDVSKSDADATEHANDAAVVTSNELISGTFESAAEVATEMSKSDKLDELTSLEREIAELHHVEPTAPATAQKVNDASALTHEELQGEKVLLEMQPPSRNSTPAPARVEDTSTTESKERKNSSAGPLEEEDLIAVLKGVENEQKQEQKPPASSSTEECDVAVGVTIEGEGEYQIMDVVDDEPEEEEVSAKDTSAPVTIVTSPKTYTNVSQKLTKEEERNLAMEQIKGLRSRMDAKRRRKQDIKPLQVETNDLVSLLGADWSDDDNSVEQQESTEGKLPTKPKAKAPTKIVVKESSNNSPKQSGEEKHVLKRRNSPPKITSVVVLKPGSVKTTDKNPDIDSGKEKKEPEPATVQPQTTGFKRTRIIKRKIIWDPDAPETQFSYAKLVRPSTSSPTTSKTNIEASSVSPSSGLTEKNKLKVATSTGVSLLKREAPSKKVRPATPKDKKLGTELAKTQVEEKGRRTSTLKSQTSTSASPTNTTAKTIASVEEVVASSLSPAKRRSQTPVTNGANKKKKVSELDRLMSDEGAVNMLNSLENERQKIAGETSGDPPKTNMRSRSATISERIVKRDLTPVKKETPVSTKPKRTPKPKASSSWDYVYKQQASEDSMIIRRRSNSSYSSTASLHRLSLDSPATSTKATKKTTPKDASPSVNTSATSSKSGNKASPKTPNTTADTSIGDISLRSSNTSLTGTPDTSLTGKTFEFAKPESKSNQKTRKSPQVNNPLTTDLKKAPSASSRRTSRSPATVDDKDKPTTKSPTNLIKEDSSTGVVLRRLGKVSQIIFNTNKSKIDYTFNSELLNILTDTLIKLSTDDECNVVVMTTNAPNFCQGVDFTDLTIGSIEKRKKAAALLGAAVKQFLKVLVTFPKPLIAGVNGSNMGLGVTILPLFDIVIASDKGSYETPYAKIGQVPEGYCIWDQLTKIRGTFKTKLFWLCEKLHSTESALSGLVNKLTAPNKVNEDALITAKKISSLSAETYRVMKKSSALANSEIISKVLDQEIQTIIEQWTSVECYENFKKYLQIGHW